MLPCLPEGPSLPAGPDMPGGPGEKDQPVSDTESPWRWKCLKDGAVIEVRQADSC